MFGFDAKQDRRIANRVEWLLNVAVLWAQKINKLVFRVTLPDMPPDPK